MIRRRIPSADRLWLDLLPLMGKAIEMQRDEFVLIANGGPVEWRCLLDEAEARFRDGHKQYRGEWLEAPLDWFPVNWRQEDIDAFLYRAMYLYRLGGGGGTGPH